MSNSVNVIVSCFNEDTNIGKFYEQAIKYLIKFNYTITFVNDGSIDNTENEINKLKYLNNRIKLISFVRNFGHEAAMCAGLDNSDSDYNIFMDVDLQNPPSFIPQIIEKLKNGNDAVLMRRVDYGKVGFIKKITSKVYYIISRSILRNKNIANVSDFFAINNELSNILKSKYRTRLRFLRGFVQNEAKNVDVIDYKSGNRASGVSRYNYIKLIILALTAELSRFQLFRNMFKENNNHKIYVLK